MFVSFISVSFGKHSFRFFICSTFYEVYMKQLNKLVIKVPYKNFIVKFLQVVPHLYRMSRQCLFSSILIEYNKNLVNPHRLISSTREIKEVNIEAFLFILQRVFININCSLNYFLDLKYLIMRMQIFAMVIINGELFL